jgi:5'(3')-deoxyribonucleotidase
MNIKRLMIDMDGVLCNFAAAYFRVKHERPEVEYPQSIPGIFEELEPIPGAIDAVNRLRERFDVWIVSAPSVRNPHCYTEKRIWIENHFGLDLAYRLILAYDKSLIIGDALIDDHVEGKGQERFLGRLIHFGGPEFPDWNAVEVELGTNL